MFLVNKIADYIHYITSETKAHNSDNISRTKAYLNFYENFPEIKWAYVASMVSRNAGWNMTDLFLSPFQKILNEKERKRLFMTYERANWLIFSDAFPQLLLYKVSVVLKQPMFHLLPHFNVSTFMQKEWNYFWNNGDQERLVIALIINEQNVIQQPVIKQDFFKRHIFWRMPYLMQDLFFLNAIILPTKSKEAYGLFVHDFTNTTQRILLGKRIASVLFHPDVYKAIFSFAKTVEHTGSRRDYEQFFHRHIENTPLLRTVYPVINHNDIIRNDWYLNGGIKSKWRTIITESPDNKNVNRFYNRRKLLYAYYHIKDIFT